MQADAGDDEKSIDFGSVGLYLAGLQVSFALVCCACASVLSCWLLPDSAISAVRTLAISASIGMMLVRKPLRVGRTRGVSIVFNALRPCVAVYILALILEQLVHTCVVPAENEEAHTTARRAIYHGISLLLVLSGFARARNPRSESDVPFLVALACLFAIAILPPPAIAKSGPLCEPTTLIGAGERVLRALLFSAVYIVLVYAATPSRNVSNELFICVARATAASIWVLSATSWVLPLAPLQVAVVLFSRLNDNDNSTCNMSVPDSSPLHYEQVPLNGATTPVDSSEDLELGSDMSDAEAVKLALATARSLSTPTSGVGVVGVGSGGGLSFNFASSSRVATNINGGSNSASIAAVAAREAHA